MVSASDINLTRAARDLNVDVKQIAATVELLDAGNTIPFITRYRKDVTGGLDEEVIEKIRDRVRIMRQLEERKQTILRSIESQGKLTEELRRQIERADHVRRLEDLYLPYRPKKQTLATKAVESGLGPLAEEILTADKAAENLDGRAADFINEDKGVRTAADALLGAGHIIAEQFSERAELRQKARKVFRSTGRLTSAKTGDDAKKNDVYRDYLEYSEPLQRIPPHRILAINRGERAAVLRVKVEADTAAIEREAVALLVPEEHTHKDFMVGCVRDSLARLLLPSLEREARRELTERAETHAVEVFARNLRKLLLQPPLPGKRVLAVDPGYKNGCKLAALDEFGVPLAHAVVFIVGKEERIAQARKSIVNMLREHDLSVIAVGNGTACRETEQLLSDVIASELADNDVAYTVVNEAGASVYSTSPIGREELPKCDATQRSAVSIGRRLQDPLSELVKIDPASIGVGLYQHDTRAKHLRETLDEVVQSCVSFVGVDLNTASASILRYVSGLNQLTARRLYEYRQENGPFRTRSQLLSVAGCGEATFTQAAGFLRISDGDEPLDRTWIHPESYDVTRRLLGKLEIDPGQLGTAAAAERITQSAATLNRSAAAGELDVGEMTLSDIVDALARPGRDPRSDLPPPIFRKDVVKLEDLEVGMELRGTVLNVVDFGAFVDVGLHDSGLVHVSQIANRFVRDPHEVVAVGDQVRVWVAAIDQERRRVALTMIEPGTERKEETRPKRHRRSEKSGKRRREGAKRPGRTPRPSRPKKPSVPITEAMAEGKEPMRTFGDLLQFYQKKQEGGKET